MQATQEHDSACRPPWPLLIAGGAPTVKVPRIEQTTGCFFGRLALRQHHVSITQLALNPLWRLFYEYFLRLPLVQT